MATALQQAGYEVAQHDPAPHLDEALVKTADVVFSVLHGKHGEDGEMQAQLDTLGVPYVGSGEAASRLCFDKWQYKQLLIKNNLLTPQGALLHDENLQQHPLAQKPFVLKPYDGGSSVDTFIVRDPATADFTTMQRALEQHGRMLLEALIEGTEITVGVLGTSALPVIEIIPPSGAEFDYENKYNGQTQELCPPPHVSDELQKQAQALALQIHTLCGCRHYSRTDIMITPEGKLQVLETNTLPGMTDQSLIPKAAAAEGITMVQLVDRLVKLAQQSVA